MNCVVLHTAVIALFSSQALVSPDPGRPQEHTRGSQTIQQQSTPTSGRAPSAKSINETDDPERTSDNRTQKASENEHQSDVKILSAPPLTVNAVKDWSDWSVVAFDFLLVIVGALQAGLIAATMRSTKVNADAASKMAVTMGEQLAAMREGLAEASRSADAATKAAQVAEMSLQIGERAYVSIIEVKLLPVGNAIMAVAVDYRNFGRTPATIIEATVVVSLEPPPLPASPDYSRAIAAQTSVTVGPSEGKNLKAGPVRWDPDTIASLSTKSKQLSVYGIIKYRDVFGQERVMKFGRYFAMEAFVTGDASPFVSINTPGYNESA